MRPIWCTIDIAGAQQWCMFIIFMPWSAWVGSSEGELVDMLCVGGRRRCGFVRGGIGGGSEERSYQCRTAHKGFDVNDTTAVICNLPFNSSSTMSIAHGIKTLGVIGAGQMGTFLSLPSLSQPPYQSPRARYCLCSCLKSQSGSAAI
jgi:hypothetical protein